MKKKSNFIDELGKRLFSSNYQIQRIIILLGIVLIIAVVGFAGYYYYDRYHTNQPTVAETNIESAEKAVRDDPQNTTKRLALAEVYMVNRRFEDAVSQALQVKQADPNDIRADFILGVSYALTNKPLDAIEPLQKFIDSQKDDEMAGLNRRLISAYYYQGSSYLAANQPEKAVAPLEQATILSTTDADAFYKLGVAYLGVKEYEKALTALYRATAFVPDFAEAYDAMASTYEAMGLKDETNYARGMVAYANKDYDTARSLLTEVTQSLPTFAPAFTGLGLTYEALSDLQSAKAAYQQATQLDPNDFTASTGLQRVESGLNK